MIRYNFRHRGTFEYDKFILTALNLANESLRVKRQLSPSAQSEIQEMLEDIEACYEALYGIDNLGLRLSLLRLKTE